jgi:hypothetical protein
MARGACGLRVGALVGEGFLGTSSDDLVVGRDGSGLFGGSDGLPIGVDGPDLEGVGGLGRSFAGGGGGTAMIGPLKPVPIAVLLSGSRDGSTTVPFSIVQHNN